MMLLTELLTIAAAAGVGVSAHSYPKNDDPTRIISGAETIDRRLRQSNLRRTKEESSSPVIARDLSEQSPLLEISPDLKIIGGTVASTDRYPYLASLNYYGSHLCGGSMVAKDMVLTAAHCSGYASTVELRRDDRSAPFDETQHERIEVAYEIKHPEWNVDTVDNDFMLMKLVKPSEGSPVVKLNTDPNFPSIPGEQMTLMGWGDTNPDPDVNEPGMQLTEIQLEYIPNESCSKKEGELEDGGYVKYESRVTDNMMCAMDEDGGRGDLVVDEDTCLGDSGGPMISPSTGNVDVQVGIVSWGIGCASPTFPGVYSRVSSQYYWIRQTVCRHSSVAPDSFECDELGESGSNGPAFPLESDDNKSVTLEVSLDEQPEEFSWIVSTLSGETSQMVAAIPPGFYSGFTSYTFHHKLQVNPNQFYRISLRDTFGDGLQGYVAVYRGSVPILSNLIMYEKLFYDKDGADNKKVDHAFYTGKDPLNYFSLAIKFDKFPRDLWWKLESETDSVILAQRPPGWYNERFELLSIVETIPVFGDYRPDVVSYRFTIGDSYPCEGDPTKVCGDGICCNYGNGQFQLFAGAVEDDRLMASGGDYGLSQSVLLSPPAQSVSL
ncbi:hypothetical protein ACHAXR_009709 [Thalassiosira sp. AJA248-18]